MAVINISGNTGGTLTTGATLKGLLNISGVTGAVLYVRGFLKITGDSNRKGIMKGY